MRISWTLACVLSLCGVAGAQIRVNAGGPVVVDQSGVAWAADTGFAGGLTWSVGSAIGGTAAPALYQTCRYGEFVYRFAVPAGNYTVNLKFAEVSETRVGDRVFHVDINGSNVLANFDIFAAGGGMNVAVDRSFTAAAAGGQIAIAFRNGPANSPLVSAIEILPASGGGGGSATLITPPAAGAIRVNAGGAAFTDSQGALWSGDTGFSGGLTWSVNSAIGGTPSPALYQTCRYGEFAYSFPVAAGNYTVNLKFAEVSQSRAGDRVFQVDINGANVLADFDIFAQAGGMNIALDKAFPVTSAGNPIMVAFRNGRANSPLISAIEIVPAAGGVVIPPPVTPPVTLPVIPPVTPPVIPPVTPPAADSLMVPPGGDFQAALDSALPGQTIVLQAGAVYTGFFTLSNKPGAGFVTVQSSALGALPPAGARVSPSDAANMPRLQSLYTNVISTSAGAHHFRFVGVELAPAPGRDIDTVVALGGGSETSVADLPHDIEFDRCYIHGDPAGGTKRGVAINGRHLAVRNSYLSDFKRVGQDTQAVAGWNGTQFIEIVNNYLEAATENVLFTADATQPSFLPQDITIRGNYLRKPLSWKADDPSFNGTHWSVKNLLELKAGLRVTIDGNVLENVWTDGQVGFAILLMSTGQSWGTVQDVTVVNNVVRHAASGIEICGSACSQATPTTTARNIVVKNNFFEDIGSTRWLPFGIARLFMVINGPVGVEFRHNTAVVDSANTLVADGGPSPGAAFTDNIAANGPYGVIGSAYGPGSSSLAAYFPGAPFAGNAIIGGLAAAYPTGNYFPVNEAAAGFTNPAGDDYSLAPGSPLSGRATSGGNPGVDWPSIMAAATLAVNGR